MLKKQPKTFKDLKSLIWSKWIMFATSNINIALPIKVTTTLNKFEMVHTCRVCFYTCWKIKERFSKRIPMKFFWKLEIVKELFKGHRFWVGHKNLMKPPSWFELVFSQINDWRDFVTFLWSSPNRKTLSKQELYCVTKIVQTYCEKKLF